MPEASVINDYLAGAIGGCAGVFVGHPLDTIKVQIQTQEYGGRYSSLMDCFRTIRSQNLSKGFFRGLSSPLMSYGFLNAIYFGSYGWVMKQLGASTDMSQKPDYLKIYISGCIAVIPQLVFSCPVEVIKVKMQTQIPHHDASPKLASGRYYNGPMDAAISIFKQSGMRGMYRGMFTQTLRDMPSSGIYILVYLYMQYEGQQKLPKIPNQAINFVAGGVAGVLSWASIMPLDVIKSKIQADPEGKVYKGFWDCCQRVYASGGMRPFFLGFTPMAVRAFPVNAVILMVYTESLLYLNKFSHID